MLPMQTESISGVIERVTFYNEENGYSVLKITPDRRYPKAEARDGTVTVIGHLPELKIGETARFTGQWVEHMEYGRQFKADHAVPILPTTKDGIINYLSSGIVSGLGPKTAEKIVAHFGKDTLHILDNHPERLEETDIKRDLIRKLQRAWAENRVVRDAMIFLQGFGVTPGMAKRIFGRYGTATINRVKEDPFALADEVFGIGFIRADEIARSMGIEPDSPNRIRAGLQFALNALAKDGHVYVPRRELIAKTAELLKVQNTDRIEAVLTSEILRGEQIRRDEKPETAVSEEPIYLSLYYHSERGVARRLRTLVETPSKLAQAAKKIHWETYLADLAKANHVDLTDQQQGAVKAALLNKVTILTGGPGTGKTTTLRMVIGALEQQKMKYALASPTGRAAKRLSEATGQPARTIHRLLEFVPGEGFDRDEDNPLEIDALIVDESSMIDLVLFYDLLKALRPETHLMLVGDVDQLPSVGAGNVLRDLIDSGLIPVTRLEMIFRQAEDSHIVVNAHRINRGDAPYMDNRSTDFFFFEKEDPADVNAEIVDLVVNRIPRRFGVDPLDDIQVIAPMYRGLAGVNALNEALQKALNSDDRKAKKSIAGRLFRVGDKVMQTRNNYELDVFNGDIGRLTAIDTAKSELRVIIDGVEKYYSYDEAEELIHAYCISTHRSQGSEYPIVVMPVLTQHYMMLQRNLLYTAVTRAKQAVVLVGTRKAVYMAVKNDKVSQRYSGLVDRLNLI
ncbi:ATP-dependent RecD-like DNA helicase [Anaerolineae bacterium CFX9]|nr:ATP-dependent RecD-like DNA helicase [Anaerolineae bacterium CFX9]